MMRNASAIRLLIAAAPILFVVMWATGFIVARYSAPHASPLAFLSIRFPLAGALFVLIALLIRAPWPGGRAALHAAIAGAFLHGGYLGPVYWAVAHGMPAGVSALIVGLQPLMTAILAARMVGEPISRRHWLGLATGILGVALVVSPKLQGGLTGGITVQFTIDPSGAVQRLHKQKDELANAAVSDCVMIAFSGISFPPPDGGPVSVVYPILFTPGR